MKTEVKITKFFPLDSERLFQYFIRKDLLEKWAAPKDMELNLSYFEPKVDGMYRYEHTSQDGTYICDGYFKQIEPGKKIVQLDKSIKDPSGKIVFENLECTIDFESKFGGTDVTVTQTGFSNEEDASQCRDGWDQSLDKLMGIVHRLTGYQSDQDSSGNEQDVRG